MSSSSAFGRPPFAPRFGSVLIALAAFVALAALGCGRRVGEITDESEHDGGPLQASAARPPGPTPPARPAPNAGEGWNGAQIDWQPYESGLRQAKAQKKPICLVFFTTWCPHCKNYSHVFDDPRVVARAHDFVMIHLDADAEEAVASKYALDGIYIPRTFFLAPDGSVDGSIHAPRLQSRYFYDERDPSSLLAAMESAHQKLVN
jgi:thiol-disulfide isomerase/thioredoxin